jgi:hypothetical protein
MINPEALLDRIAILGSTEVPEQALKDFFKRMYPDRAEFLIRHWRWLYRIDEFPDLEPPLVAVLDDRVIGHVAQIPVYIRRGEQELLVAWGVDGGVLHPYRGSGIGWRLMDLWNRRYSVGMGFCTEALFRILIKQGWSPRRTTYYMHLPLKPHHHPKFRRKLPILPPKLGGTVWNLAERLIITLSTQGWKPLRRVPFSEERLKNWSVLYHPTAWKAPLHVARTADFLRWRLLRCPFRDQYHILEMEETSLAAVVRVFQIGDLRRARIISISGRASSRGDVMRFLGSLASWAMKQDVDILSMVHGDPRVVRWAHHWFPIRSQLRFASICNDPRGEKMLRGEDHIWELIDYDLDFLIGFQRY